MSSAPLISVIIVNHNGGSRLSATLASVWEQRGIHPQIIVLDRGSTDESVRWLEAQRTRLATLELVEGECHYGAANRGIAVPADEPLRLECAAFLGSVAERTPPLTDGPGGLRVMAVLEACRRSMEHGGQIRTVPAI